MSSSQNIKRFNEFYLSTKKFLEPSIHPKQVSWGQTKFEVLPELAGSSNLALATSHEM